MHIFLTGEKRAGKTTLLKKIIETIGIEPKGFRTVAGEKEADGYEYIYIIPYGEELKKEKTQPVGARKKGGFPKVFDKIGVKILRDTLDPAPKLIIMDELGFMESDARFFKKAVLDILDGDIPVLGVIKPRHTVFLDGIRDRDDVRVIEVTEGNRNDLKKEIEDILIEQMYG